MDSIEEYIQDETDAAFLYRTLAEIERKPELRESFERLAEVEATHRARWVEHLEKTGGDAGAVAAAESIRPSPRARVLAWLARRLGPRFLVPMLRAEEAREVEAYLEIAERAGSAAEREVAAELARDSADHARVLRSEEHTSELQSRLHLVCRLLLEK